VNVAVSHAITVGQVAVRHAAFLEAYYRLQIIIIIIIIIIIVKFVNRHTRSYRGASEGKNEAFLLAKCIRSNTSVEMVLA